MLTKERNRTLEQLATRSLQGGSRLTAVAPRRLRRQLARRHGVTLAPVTALLPARAGLSPVASADTHTATSAQADPDESTRGTSERRTLFFNLAHEDFKATSHFLVAGARRYELKKVHEHPQVLERARETNTFLRAVPDDQITHHIEDMELATDITTLAYIGGNEDTTTGTWTMSMIIQCLPTTSIGRAYQAALAAARGGPLALSVKRQLYGLPPARTQQDLLDEQSLVDSTDHARTLIGLHPDLLCAEPAGAQHIHVNYILPNANTRFLAAVLTSKGPATPQQTPNQPNDSGWATLLPINQDNGEPFKNSKGLNQYFPDWDAAVDSRVAIGIKTIHTQVKNDDTLGSDITSVPPPTEPIESLAGTTWYRRDGAATVVHTASGAVGNSSLRYDFQHKEGAVGLIIGDPTLTPQDDGSVLVALSNVQNWFLRFLGVWVQFLDANGNVIPVSELPPGTIPGETDVQRGMSKPNVIFLGVLPPAYTIAGIPVAPGFVTPTFVIPPNGSGVKFLLAGMGFSGSWNDPDGIIPVGAVMTAVVNWGIVALFMGAGVSTLGPAIKSIAMVASIIVAELVAALGAAFTFREQPSHLVIVGLMARALQAILNGLAGKGITALIAAISAQLAAAEIIDEVPIAGQIARAVAAVIGAVSLAETLVEIGMSPPIYEFDLSLTHDLSVNVQHDPNNNQFPQVPAGYTLYYKVTYMFDNGTPHVLDGVPVPDPTVQQIPITLNGVPHGGQVNISIGFYARKSTIAAGQNDWCAAKGTTGLVSNLADQAPDITIEQLKIPIQSSTRYIHTRKLQLDSQGSHYWSSTAPAPIYVAPSGGQQPGQLGAFRSITVRQGTSKQQGYVGYAWQAYSRRLLDCTAGSPGQLDQAANLNTDAGNSGAHAQNGYVTTACGLQGGGTGGMKLAYSLLGHDSANFYLDTSTLLVRQVELDPPGFVKPNGGEAFARLNLDSTVLLLHPAGHIVSINNANHKLETLKLPAAPLTDDDAAKLMLARVYSGQGSRPGLMMSPAAAAISPDGVILVLEAHNNRIQALDLGGNPVQFFKQQSIPYFLQLDATDGKIYLDLAVEFTGYLYVLSQDPSTLAIRLDIYHPGQTGTQPLSTTPDVNGARLTVDFWRSIYTLNYEVLQLPGGAIPDMTEPSVSLWVPTPP